MTNFPKFEYFRSREHLKNVASLPCQWCGVDGTTQAAHSNQAIHGKSRGLKSSDAFAVALCAHHHYELDQGRTMSRTERVEMFNHAYIRTVAELRKYGLWPENICPKLFCGGQMVRGVAIEQTSTGSPDFAGGEVITVSPGGPGKLISCVKCVKCGFSVT